jgi:hypothetical protein
LKAARIAPLADVRACTPGVGLEEAIFSSTKRPLSATMAP